MVAGLAGLGGAAGASGLGLSAAEGSLLGGIFQGGSSLLGGLFGASGQEATNAQSIAAAQAAENFQHNETINVENWEEGMSNTAYQRAMADMRTAGLNPILAANLGGASTPSVGIPSGQMPNLGNAGALLGQGVASAGQAANTVAQLKVAANQADKDASQTDLNKTASNLNDAQTANTRATTANVGATGDKIRQDTATGAANADAARASAAASSASAGLDIARTEAARADAHTARNNAEMSDIELQKRRIVGAPAAGPIGHAFQDVSQIGGNLINSIRDAYKAAQPPPPAGNSAKQVAPYQPF